MKKNQLLWSVLVALIGNTEQKQNFIFYFLNDIYIVSDFKIVENIQNNDSHLVPIQLVTTYLGRLCRILVGLSHPYLYQRV